jgi:hypothetical protein
MIAYRTFRKVRARKFSQDMTLYTGRIRDEAAERLSEVSRMIYNTRTSFKVRGAFATHT